MAEPTALLEPSARALTASRRVAASGIALPRPVGLTIALGISLGMWAVLIEVGLYLRTVLPPL